MKIEGLSLIGFKRGQPNGKTFSALNPASGESLPGEFYSASAAEARSAAQLAMAAFAAFSPWSGGERAELLNCIAELLEANAAAIIERANLETALPLARLQGELARTCFQLRFYGRAAASGLGCEARIDHAEPDRKPLPKPDLRSVLKPLGPVAVFGASNFPLAFSVAGGDTASALAAGCPVVVKAHPAHPGTSEIIGVLVQQAMQKMNAPEGVFSLLFDKGHEIGAVLVKHTQIKAVAFTGSRFGGRALMDLAAARTNPIPVFAEMSSVNPVFILPGILRQKVEDIAVGLHGAVTLGVGQFCTNPGLVLLEKGEAANTFLKKLAGLMSATAPGTMLTAGICAAYQAKVKQFSKISEVQCVSLAVAGTANNQANAVLFVTTANTFLANHALMEEVFGPATLVVECASREEMLAAARMLEGQLTATVHGTTEELVASRELVALLETKAGRLIFNGFPTGVEVTHAMIHGGPYPATSDGRSTSVGSSAIQRFLRPVSYQNFPDEALPDELKEQNPLGLRRLVDGKY